MTPSLSTVSSVGSLARVRSAMRSGALLLALGAGLTAAAWPVTSAYAVSVNRPVPDGAGNTGDPVPGGASAGAGHAGTGHSGADADPGSGSGSDPGSGSGSGSQQRPSDAGSASSASGPGADRGPGSGSGGAGDPAGGAAGTGADRPGAGAQGSRPHKDGPTASEHPGPGTGATPERGTPSRHDVSDDPSRAGSVAGEGRERPGRTDDPPARVEGDDGAAVPSAAPDGTPGDTATGPAPVPPRQVGQTAGQARTAAPALRVLPLGSGLVLIGLGLALAFVGLRLRQDRRPL